MYFLFHNVPFTYIDQTARKMHTDNITYIYYSLCLLLIMNESIGCPALPLLTLYLLFLSRLYG